jgi:hypothetical protein
MREFAFGFAANGTVGRCGEVAAALGDQNLTREQPRDYDDDRSPRIHAKILARQSTVATCPLRVELLSSF